MNSTGGAPEEAAGAADSASIKTPVAKGTFCFNTGLADKAPNAADVHTASILALTTIFVVLK